MTEPEMTDAPTEPEMTEPEETMPEMTEAPTEMPTMMTTTADPTMMPTKAPTMMYMEASDYHAMVCSNDEMRTFKNAFASADACAEDVYGMKIACTSVTGYQTLTALDA